MWTISPFESRTAARIIGMSIVLSVLILVAALSVGYALVTFNRLVALRNACANARAGIDVNLKRRHQLIPNLVSTVQGYMAHERETLTAVTASRQAAIASLGAAGSAAAEQALEHSVAALTARAEAYPGLKADGIFLNLMKNLTEAEEQISASRRAFNAQVMRMNNLVQQFPSMLVAGLTGFGVLRPFSAESAAQANPNVQLQGPSAHG